MLQIETILNVAGSLSRSVTARSIYAELLLQIETNRRRHPPFSKNHPKVSVPFGWFASGLLLDKRVQPCPYVDRRGRDLGEVEQRTSTDTYRHGKHRGEGDEWLFGTLARARIAGERVWRQAEADSEQRAVARPQSGRAPRARRIRGKRGRRRQAACRTSDKTWRAPFGSFLPP